MDLGLSGKRVLITGGSKGIGLACAAAFAAEGAAVVLCARDAGRLGEAERGLRSRHQVEVATISADLSKSGERERLAKAFPDIDILVNNAGAIPGGSLFDISLERWQEAWQLKVFGYVHMTQLYLAGMQAKKAGTIINIIGMAGQAPRWDYVCGSVGNAGLIAFTKAIGAQSVDWNVRVFGINPTATRTDRIITLSKTRAKTRFGDESRWEETLGNMPFNRLSEPEEVGHLAAMLAAPQVAYLSGTVIDLDGGGLCRGGR
jgi:3-oxoacyl-[acyl-carrier protein] reductase